MSQGIIIDVHSSFLLTVMYVYASTSYKLGVHACIAMNVMPNSIMINSLSFVNSCLKRALVVE